MNYTYEVTVISKDGFAAVEYRHEELGSVIKTFFVPYDTANEATIRRMIAEQFPMQIFYSRYLMKSSKTPDKSLLVSGQLEISFADRFYDVQIETAKTVSL